MGAAAGTELPSGWQQPRSELRGPFGRRRVRSLTPGWSRACRGTRSAAARAGWAGAPASGSQPPPCTHGTRTGSGKGPSLTWHHPDGDPDFLTHPLRRLGADLCSGWHPQRRGPGLSCGPAGWRGARTELIFTFCCLQNPPGSCAAKVLRQGWQRWRGPPAPNLRQLFLPPAHHHPSMP